MLLFSVNERFDEDEKFISTFRGNVPQRQASILYGSMLNIIRFLGSLKNTSTSLGKGCLGGSVG